MIEPITKLIQVASKAKWYVLLAIVFTTSIVIFEEELGIFLKSQFTKTDYVQKSIDKGMVVHEVMEMMMNEYSADRAFVFRFHNGVNYYDGNHKVKASMDYEVVQRGVTSIGLLLQDVSTTLFSRFINDIINRKVMGAGTSDLNDAAASALMKQVGASHLAALPYYENGRVIMVVGVAWVNKDNVSLIEGRFEDYVINIGNILTDRPYEEVVDVMSPETHITRGGESIPRFVQENSDRLDSLKQVEHGEYYLSKPSLFNRIISNQLINIAKSFTLIFNRHYS